MLHSVIKKRLVQIAFFPFFGLKNSHDIKPDKKLDEITPTRVVIDKINDFLYDKNGHNSTEVQSIINSTSAGVILGFIIGSIPRARFAAENFIAENQATIFKNQYDAKRQLHYKVAVAIFKGGVPFAIKLGTFCFLFSTTASVLYSYRGVFYPSQHMIAGAVTGFIYKLNTGLKGAFAGCFAGTVLGSISGIVSSLVLYITGTEMDKLLEANNKWISMRREMLNEQTKFMNEETKMFKEIYNENQNIRKIVYGDETKKKT